jgi:hypothetical protein
MQVKTNQSSLATLRLQTTSASQNKQTLAHQSYRHNASTASVIDAEYVEISHPAKETFIRERQDLDLSVTTKVVETDDSASATQEQRALRSRFQTVQPETPPPGTYINIFA